MKQLNLSYCRAVFIVLIFASGLVHTCEYVYPVTYAHTPYGLRILLIYQDVSGQVGLYTWDPESKVVRKAMPSYYDPSCISMLPDESGFSFIDNGILRVKKFAKRSARTIEMLDPLYSLTSVNWIDSSRACVSAKRRNYYEIFEIDLEGTVESVIAFEGIDCLYPQKVDSSLFYVEYNQKNKNNYIVRIDYPKIERISLGFNDSDHFDYRVQRIIQNDFERDIYACNANLETRTPLCAIEDVNIIGFTMISESMGLLSAVKKQEGIVGECICFEVRKVEESDYSLELLFNFTIPIFPSRLFNLYESFIPLLPVFDCNHSCIYFSDTVSDGCIALFTYDYRSKKITQVSISDQIGNYFGVLAMPEGVWYGGTIASNKVFNCSSSPHLWINEDQMVCLQLPKMDDC